MPKPLDHPWTSAELGSLPPGTPPAAQERSEPAKWNPFAEVTDHPVGLANAKAWQRIHDGPIDAGGDADPLDDILHAARARLAGVFEVHHPESGELTALFPSVPFFSLSGAEGRNLTAAWEDRSLKMHAHQRRIMPEDLPPKEDDTRGPAFNTLRRGD